MLSSTRVGHVEGFGRVLVANKAFLVGDEVLREAPLLSWPSENWAVYVDALCAAGEATRAAVLDLFHPPLDSGLPVVAGLRAIAVRLAGEGRPEFCDVDFVHTALLVAELNAHACDNGARKAMFQQASKAAHSCAPNAAYSSRDVPGHLVYKAIKPIAAGEQITFSYIADLFLTPTEGRRARLMETKLFTCHCLRCDAPDPLRSFACHCGSLVMPLGMFDSGADGGRPAGEDPAGWRCCDGCDAVSAERLAQHCAEEDALNDTLQSTAGAALSELELDVPTGLEACLQRLSRMHTITMQGHKLFGTVLAVRANDAREQGDPREGMLWCRAAAAKLQAVRLMECVAAGCRDRCQCVNKRHPAVYQASPDVFDAAKNLAQAVACDAEGVSDQAAHVVRYMPSMFTMWPKLVGDATMMQMLDVLKGKGTDSPCDAACP